MLSPAESLGLAGAALDARARRAASHISDAALRRIADSLRADALDNGMIYERNAVAEPIRVMLRPLLAMPEQLSYVNHVCLTLIKALKRLPSLYLEHDACRRILALTPAEDAWLREAWSPVHARLNPVYGRLDAVCDFAGAAWRDSLQFLEPNLNGIGGIHYTPVAEQLVLRDIVPALQAHDPELAIELPYDQREEFVQLLIDHTKAVGRSSCQVCFVEPKYVHEGPSEQAALIEFLARRNGIAATHADPRELTVRGDEVFHGDARIDVAYRDYEVRDLIALEAELGRRLEGMRMLFKQNRVISSLGGDFDQKSCWEILTDPAIAETLFQQEECRLFRRHVLWTRVVSARRTTLPQDREGDLLTYARDHREQLVLKPSRAYGGTGVMLGAAVSQGAWETQLEAALAQSEDPEQAWVVQAATRLPVHEFPVIDETGHMFSEPFYTVMGFAPSENGLGTLCRVSQKQVVNVAQHGGLAALLIANPPRELRIAKRPHERGAAALSALRAKIAEIIQYDQINALLGWDEETMLPRGGRQERGRQLALLEGARHALLQSDALGDLIGEAELACQADPVWTRELVLLRRLRRQALHVDGSLVEAFAEARSRALGAWEEARERNDFAGFSGPFESLLALVRERAQASSGGGDPYDALLDEFEPGMRRARLDPVLASLKDGLVPLVAIAEDRRRSRNVATPTAATFAREGQRALCKRILDAMRFDFERGRLDESTHPFTLMAGSSDVRMTIRIEEQSPAPAVLATLHEGGHGLYDQGLDKSLGGWLAGEAAGMGVHESQARLWENHVGRSREFWQHLAPDLKELFPEAMRTTGAASIARAVNHVQAGLNRVGADELTYHLHIIVRYELEQALVTGELSVAELPAAWNARYAALLGVRPDSDREGVLQDVHWALGMLGYFPSYTIGSLYAAELADAYDREHDLADEVARGDLASLGRWLRQSIHEQGHLKFGDEIVASVTGRPLDTAAFFRRAEKIARME